MRKTLEAFFYGNIRPSENQMVPNSDLQRAVDKATDVMVALVLGGMPLSGGPRSKISAGLFGCCDHHRAEQRSGHHGPVHRPDPDYPWRGVHHRGAGVKPRLCLKNDAALYYFNKMAIAAI